MTHHADVEALTTNRVYLPAFWVQDALNTMKADIGHFDPEIMAAFFDIRDDIVEVRNSYEMRTCLSLSGTNPWRAT